MEGKGLELTRAAAEGALETLQALLATPDADVNAQDEEGDTALHAACAHGHVEVVRWLLEAGARLDVRNEEGDSVLHAAASGGYAALVDVLVAAGFEEVNVQNEDGWTPAHLAVKAGRREVLLRLVTHGADLSLVSNEGDSILHVAASVDNVNAIQYLLEEGRMEVDLRNEIGRTALHQAAADGSIGAVEELLAKGADLSAADQENQTPLFRAAVGGHSSVAELLLGRGADVNAAETDGWLPIHGAAQSGDVETVKVLVGRGANIHCLTQDKQSVLHIAARYSGSTDAVAYFLENGLEIDAKDDKAQTPLFAAVVEGHGSVVQLLVGEGADVNARDGRDWVPLHCAAQWGDMEMIKLLIQLGADMRCLTQSRQSMLHMAARFCGSPDAVAYFLENGLEIDAKDEKSQTPLFAAVSKGHRSVVELLAEKGADVNAQDESGRVPLHVAAQAGDVEMIKILVDHQADIYSLTQDKQSVLHIAAGDSGSSDAVQYFLKIGLEIDAIDDDQQTPLFAAALDGNRSVVELLVNAGADVSAADVDGWVPLHGAAQSGDVETVKLLIERGADAHCQTLDGRSVLHVAIQSESKEVVEFLIHHGLSVNQHDVITADEDGWTAIHYAAHIGDAKMIKLLLDLGADVHAVQKYGWSAMHFAARSGNVEAIKLLLDEGADVNSKCEDGWSALHAAVEEGHEEAAKLLTERGADINSTDEKTGWCMFLAAAYGGSIALLDRSIELCADPNAVDEDGMNALHHACSQGKAEAAQHVVGLGLDMNAVDKDARTALYHAVKAESSSCVTYLLQAGAKESVEKPDKDGYRPLHLAAMAHFIEATTALLAATADVHALTNDGQSPLQLVVFGEPGNSALSTVRVQCSFGAQWTPKCQDQLVVMKADVDLSEVDSADQRFRRLQWLSGLRACILLWEQQYHDAKQELTEVPEEVVQRGEASVRTYIADATSSNADELKYRCKVCVVGPSEWGKSSLVRSIETMKPFLMDVKDRTVGIELVPTTLGNFVKKPTEDRTKESATPKARDEQGETDSENLTTGERPKRHEITFWDFAGQDVYQVAHSLFFSRRTLYVLVIDVKAYWKQLQKVQSLRPAAAEATMDRFLSRYVFRWVRTIFARRTDAEFLVLGTKADLLEDEEKDSMEVWRDLQSRIYQWKLNYMREIEAEFGVVTKSSGVFTGRKATTTRDKRGTATNSTTGTARIQELTDKLARLASDKWLVVSVTRSDSIEKVRQALQRTIEASERGFPMWNKYSRVLEAISVLRAEANNRPGDGLRRIELGMMLFRPLCMHLMDAVDGLEYDECREILRTLHDLGDVIWYEREDSGELRDFIILDPMLVIDIVREVISHEHKKKSSGAIENGSETEEKPRIDGRVSHSLLETFPLWKHMDKELMYAFKMLLKQFQLAYPADDEVMDPESDLIVPSYWKAQLEDSSGGREVPTPASQGEADHVSRPNHYCWEYEVSADLSDAIFEQFAVQSYTSFMKRAVRANCIESSCAEFQSWITLHPGASKHDVIRVEVASEVADIAWLNMRYYLMKLEKVLDGYTGLAVPRYVVVEDKRHSLSPATKAVRDSIMMGRDVDSLRLEMPWLPPDLDWFINRAWRNIGAFQELQMMHLVRDKLNVLQKLVVTSGSQRRYPALWSLEYVAEKHLAVLRMLSDLSGKCYHVPIEIEVGSAFLAKHGSKIKEGISLLTNVVPSSLSVPVLQTAIDGAVSRLDAKSQRAAQIHNLIKRMDVKAATGDVIKNSKDCGLSPGGAMAVLIDLLKLHNDSLDELSITEICNLECAATSKGEYVWAHAQEIHMLKSELTPCEPRFKATSRSAASAGVEPSAEPQPIDTIKSKAKSLCLSLCVKTVTGLADWDWYKTYCTWQLLYKDSKTPLASGATPSNTDTNAEPSWSSLNCRLDAIDSANMLAECRLVVHVKRRSRIGWTKLIGEGQVALGSLVKKSDEATAFNCEPIQVELQTSGSSTKRFVLCQISASN